MTQLPLFQPGDTPPAVRPAKASSHLMELASKLPEQLYLGTSSWSFPGWKGIVYDRTVSPSLLSRQGLSAYSRYPLFRAVGIDRSYYGPIPAEDFGSYANAVPEKFRFLVKAHEAVTRAHLHQPVSSASPIASDVFLDSDYAKDEVIGPCREGLGEKAFVLLFQFPPQSLKRFGSAEGFAERLHRFLTALPPELLYAVEIRNPELLGEPYVKALRDAGATHCFNVHPSMPGLEAQWRIAEPATQKSVVIRWMLRRNLHYESARAQFHPFNRLVAEDPEARSGIAQLCRTAIKSGRLAFVIANNKAEGSAPLSLERLAEELVD